MKEFESITKLARSLRRNQTDAEKKLWHELRNRKLGNKKFLRQHPIIYEEINGKKHFFIADYYCAERRLVLELDGKIHEFQKDYDQERDHILQAMGLQILHIKNEETRKIDLVLKKMKDLF
ncbi:MAG: endonuclease domain-containing protein [Bacteroidetes bacterium]|nr:endonuclease domain-containing protein [Bacteroidota bacterium]